MAVACKLSFISEAATRVKSLTRARRMAESCKLSVISEATTHAVSLTGAPE